MTVESVITSVLGAEDFARYEQNLYEKYQDRAEREMIAQLNELLSNGPFLMLLKQWSARCACRFLEPRKILGTQNGRYYTLYAHNTRTVRCRSHNLERIGL